MKKGALLAVIALAGCRGSVPAVDRTPEHGVSSIAIGCRLILPTGETRSGRMTINLDNDARSSDVYRLPLVPQVPLLYQVEPGAYKLAPTRGLFGFHQPDLKVVIEGRSYRVPFPREMLRKPAFVLKPTKIVAVGVVEASLSERLPGRAPAVKVRLDDSVAARRSLVQELIRAQMNPDVPAARRASAIAWTRALEQALSDLVTESQREPAFRAAP